MSHSKYRASKTEYKGVKYDSKLEAAVAQRLDELRDMNYDDHPKIVEILRQVAFELIPKHGSERTIVYRADFIVLLTYPGTDSFWRFIVEVKGYETAVWKLKRRLFLHLYPEADLRIVGSVADVNRVVVENWHGR